MIDISTTVGTVKAILGVAQQAGRIDLTQQIIDLQMVLVQLVTDNAELTAKLAQVESEFRDTRQQLNQQEEFVYDRDAYWRVQGEDAEGPFCSKCFDVDRKAVRMHAAHQGYSFCPNCKTSALVNPAEKPPRSAPRIRYSRNWVTDW